MATATYQKINDFAADAPNGVHDLSSDQLTVALSNTAPGSESSDPSADGNGVLANVTEISYTNLSSRDITTTSSTQTGGTYDLVLEDLTLTASGSVGPFQYVYIFNNAAASDNLIAYGAYPSSITMSKNEVFKVTFPTMNKLFSLS